VRDLGRRPYAEALELQRELRRRRAERELDHDVLLLTEHPPVVTLGRGTRTTSLPYPAALLERRGAEVFEVERGGDVTFHGPGQLVGYPIVDLTGHRRDLHWYLRRLGRKIASIGIHVKQWVTLHGFALNVTTDLSWFDLIVPCGIEQVVMTSLAEELLREDHPALEREARQAVMEAFAEVFGYELVVPAPTP